MLARKQSPVTSISLVDQLPGIHVVRKSSEAETPAGIADSRVSGTSVKHDPAINVPVPSTSKIEEQSPPGGQAAVGKGLAWRRRSIHIRKMMLEHRLSGSRHSQSSETWPLEAMLAGSSLANKKRSSSSGSRYQDSK